MKSIGIKLLVFLINVLRIAFVLFMFLLLILFLSQFIEDIGKYPYLEKINSFTRMFAQPILEHIKLTVPYKYEGINYSPLLFIVILIILVNICLSLKEKLLQIGQRVIAQQNYYEWRKQMAQSIANEKLPKDKLYEIDDKFIELDKKFELMNAAKKPEQKKQLLKEFSTLKSKLDTLGQQLAFLSIDVVDPTGLKLDEDEKLAANDFDTFNKLVDSSLMELGVVKYTKTVDGTISCFRTVDDAVLAAKTLLKNLKKFNSSEKSIKKDFKIRCGINAGFVYMDLSTPLNQIADRSIDIAINLQKFAKPNCINIAATAIEPLKGREGFDETADVIDDQKVYQWSLK